MTTTAKKPANYPAPMLAEIKTAYAGASDYDSRSEVIRKMALKFDKTVQSIRAKLTRENVYIPKEYKTKTGAKPARKSALVDSIAKLIGVESETLDSLEKANKTVLERLIKELTPAEFVEDTSDIESQQEQAS